MLQYIRDHFTALYLTDANGVPTQHDLLDAEGVSLLTGATPAFQVPNTFATNQWSVATGSNPAQINITISVLPANNGSPITAIQYRVGTGAWVALPEATTGTYPVTMPATSTAYNISLRAVNIVGPSAQSAAKTATSGAPAATAPASFGPTQWTLATGAEPASLALNVLTLPADGGSAITALEYRVGSGEWVALEGAGTGPRSITMPQASTAYTVTIRAVNSVGASSPSAGKTATSAAPAQQAPSVETPPSITGGTTVGSILTRAAGTATGNPTPTRATAWLRNGTILSGQTGNTLDTTGFAVDDSITTRDIWTNSQGTATGTSDPIVLTAQPTLQATITPDPLVAGQPASVTFSTAIDGPPTIAQGQTAITATRVGTTNEWTFTPVAAGTLIIAATAAGYASSPWTIDVSPALPSAAKTADNKVIINSVTPQSAPFGFTIGLHPTYGGKAVTVADPADLGDHPVCLIAPVISAAGSVLTALPGLWGSLRGSATILGEWYRGGVETGVTSLTYNVGPADDGAVMTYREIATDATGSSDPVPSNGITVSAPQPASYTSAGTGSVYNTEAQTQHTIAAVPLGAASADRFIELDLNAYLITDSTAVITGVSIGGVAATQRAAQANGNEPKLRTGLWRAAVPSGTTADVVITLDKPSALIAGCHAFRAIRMISGTPTFGNISLYGGETLSTTVATVPGDRIIFTIGTNGGAASGGWWGSPVGHTEVADFAGAPGKGDNVRTNLYIGMATVAPGDTSPRTLSVTSQGAVLTRATHIVRKVTEIV